VRQIKKTRRQTPKSRAARVITLVVVLCLIYLITYLQLRPAVQNAAAYQVNLHATRVINAAILAQLSEERVGYHDLIRLTHNQGGDIVAIESDMQAINRLKAQVTQSIVESLEEMGTTSLRLPVGTLMGNELTAGRGPMVEIRIYPIGYVETDLFSSFTEAGINQTLHQIMLGTTVRMRAVIPGYRVTAEVATSIGVAETVIVGNIPDAYARINMGGNPFTGWLGG